MTRKEITVTQKDIREFARMLQGMNNEVQDMKESRRSGTTVVIFRSTQDKATADDTVTQAQEITDPIMTWDTDAWDGAEWAE